jgi:hypothetical protein
MANAFELSLSFVGLSKVGLVLGSARGSSSLTKSEGSSCSGNPSGSILTSGSAMMHLKRSEVSETSLWIEKSEMIIVTKLGKVKQSASIMKAEVTELAVKKIRS